MYENFEGDVEGVLKCIFNYDIKGMAQNITKLLTEISQIVYSVNKQDEERLNEILKYIGIGMQNQDYLLVADILNFELKPFISDITKYVEEINE